MSVSETPGQPDIKLGFSLHQVQSFLLFTVSETRMVAGTTAAAGVVSQGDWTLGLSASALSGLSSAYAGVYFEKYVKGKMSSTLWIRNLQLGIYGLPLSIAYMFAKDHGNLRHGGIMQVSTHVHCTAAIIRNKLYYW